jgi:hypothetical protein
MGKLLFVIRFCLLGDLHEFCQRKSGFRVGLRGFGG